MEPAYRKELREKYLGPLRWKIALIIIMFLVLSAPFLKWPMPPDQLRTSLVFIGALAFFCFSSYLMVRRNRRSYFEDAQYGFVIRERMAVTKVFSTPAGINIYWLDSSDIPTFSPDPYRIFHVGDPVTIYYLKYSRKYLAYEL